jgi:Holliday junction resolvase
MNSQRKGACGERELLAILLEHGISANRNIQRYIGGRNNPDISAEYKGRKLHIEVKRRERLDLRAAINQAVTDADGKAFPLVIHRSSRQPWLVTFRLDDFFKEVDG